MIIDSSALAAIVFDEPDAAVFALATARAGEAHVSAVSLFEIEMVTLSRREGATALLNHLLAHAQLIEVPFDRPQRELALQAFERYGKGRHPARLNLGDCCSYALAKLRNEPLLYKGDDFAKTDIVSAI